MLIDQIKVATGKSIFDADISTLKPFQIAQAEAKFSDAVLRLGVLFGKPKQNCDQSCLLRG